MVFGSHFLCTLFTAGQEEEKKKDCEETDLKSTWGRWGS